jgi:hypothetical protein
VNKQTEEKLQRELWRLGKSIDPRVRQMIWAMRQRHPGVMERLKGTETELSAVAAKSSAGNVLLPGCDDHATMTARPRCSALFPDFPSEQKTGSVMPDSEVIQPGQSASRAVSPTRD